MVESSQSIGADSQELTPEDILKLKDDILSVWGQLPIEDQATMALALLNDVRRSEWGGWLIEAMGTSWQTEQELNEPEYSVISLSRSNLHLAFSEEEIAQFSDRDIKELAEELSAGFNVDPSFWYLVEMTGNRILQERNQQLSLPLVSSEVIVDPIPQHREQEFSSWMHKVDQLVWNVVGCSVYDLPDSNFRSMFEDLMEPEVVAQEVLREAGWESFE